MSVVRSFSTFADLATLGTVDANFSIVCIQARVNWAVSVLERLQNRTFSDIPVHEIFLPI